MTTYTLKVVAVNKETDDAVTICFKQPGLKKINYKPGQYITVMVVINGRKYNRPYSLSSAPGIDSTLNITIKRVTNGIVSNHLLDVVKEGDLLEIMAPMGHFVYDIDTQSDKEIFLWGAGSGVTPLMSILKTALLKNSNKINFYYCNKTIEATIFYHELIQIKQSHPDRVNLQLYCTQEETDSTIAGRISIDSVKQALSTVDIADTLHYICGPTKLKETIKELVLAANLPEQQLFYEDFEHVVDANEFNDIQTRFVEIRETNKLSTVEVVRGKSILDACLDYGINLPYSCQNGSCTLCKAKLVSGMVKKINTEKMDKEISENEELLCCSYPLTDNVIFEINY